ncbi:MAG: hypothetical protein IPI92_18570 [Gemmatimonadetes bacterium]|nr:hypothetical protein [Gemmatimonadota bacterium]MBK7785100.1 hypothetical protein [Gemmatimonadota bacterium]
MSPAPDDPVGRPDGSRVLGPVPEPPAHLERRVLATLRARGALTIPGGRRWGRGWLAAAALVAAFLGGRASAARAGEVPTGQRWMLLLYEDAGFRPPPPGAEQVYVEEYRAWAAALRRRGQLVEGAELLPAAAALGRGGAAALEVMPEPARLTGYFILVAPSLDSARAIASGIPHLRHNGRVVIQPFGAS